MLDQLLLLLLCHCSYLCADSCCLHTTVHCFLKVHTNNAHVFTIFTVFRCRFKLLASLANSNHIRSEIWTNQSTESTEQRVYPTSDKFLLFSLAKTAHVNALRYFNTGRWICHTRLWVRVTKTLYLNRLEVSNPRWRTMNSLLWIFLEDFRSVQTSRQLTEF